MKANLVRLFKAMADETRIDIMRFLLENSELSCQEISKRFPLSQPALSHHFSKLIGAKIINIRKEGVANFYSINYDYLKEIGIDINKIIKKEDYL